jgi:Glycoside Hydrolase Family 113
LKSNVHCAILLLSCFLASCQSYQFKRAIPTAERAIPTAERIIPKAERTILKAERIILKAEGERKIIKSVVLTSYGVHSYKKRHVEEYIKKIKELGANTASLLITCYTDNSKDPDIDCQGFDTPSTYEIRDAAQLIQEAGLLLNIRVYVDMKNGQWRCHWNPNDGHRVFNNIKEMLISYGEFAEELKAESMIIGAEYCYLTMRKNHQKWEKIILRLREVFKGKLSYGANWELPFAKGAEYEQVSFWKDLDWIGIDYYMPLKRSKRITKKSLLEHHQNQLRKVSMLSRSTRKPLIISEIGFPLEKGGAYEPFKWDLTGKASPELQSLNFQTFFESLKNFKNIHGIFIWRLMPEDFYQTKEQRHGYSILDGETFNVIKKFWERKL